MEQMKIKILKLAGWQVFEAPNGKWMARLECSPRACVPAEEAWAAHDARFVSKQYDAPS